MIGDHPFLPFPIKHLCFGMGDFKKIKQRRLLDLVLNTFVGVIIGKRFFPHGIEKFCIKGGGIVYFLGLADHFRRVGAVITEIRSNPQCNNIVTVFKAGLKGDDFFRIFPGHLNSLFMMSRLRWVWLPGQYILPHWLQDRNAS